ncbi:ATP-binding cassette sub-family A member 3 [Nymphon striatum]|nr:ATP-binding cassette sub-family A member 3 [Nymphon striatum]
MGDSSRNFRILLWKNAILLRRNRKTTLLELLLPILIPAAILLIRLAVKGNKYDDTTVYSPYSLENLPHNLTSPTKNPWLLAYTPNNSLAVRSVMTEVSKKLNISAEGFVSEEDFINKHIIISSKDAMRYLGIIAFESLSNGTFNKDIKFKVRLSPTPFNYKHENSYSAQTAANKNWDTDKQYPDLRTPVPTNQDSTWGGPPGYMSEGFLPLQHAVSSGIISYLSGQKDVPSVDMQRYPFPPYTSDPFAPSLKLILPLVIVFSFIYPYLNIVKSIVHEKEKKLKESMKMMGMSNWLHWAARFVRDFGLLFISTIIMTVIVSQTLPKSSFLSLLIFFTVVTINIITFAYFISSLFSKGSGLQFSNFNTAVSPDDSLTVLDVVLMLLFDSLLYAVVTWYVEGVYPGNFGLSRPFYFPFTIVFLQRSYWLGTASTLEVKDVVDEDEDKTKNEYIEANPTGLKTGVQIQRLTKSYRPNTFAVKDLSLNMYENQITCLLGHNGAGKTTTIAMLTGMFPSTCGTALVNDFDIQTSISDVRKSLGFCPQHDILFDELTVEEHLQFYCTLFNISQLKGYDESKIKIEIGRMLKMLNLEDKREALSKTLSGGMKRKLSVGIALCANSKIVLLDEPTSGMDPAARRSTWDLLNQQKTNRTILLTTHYMEEADVLGDRIAILASGQLQCCGSSMFLKNKYGAGYHMTLVKEEDSCDINSVTELVNKFVPNAEIESNVGAELSFILPRESSPNFQALFQNIEDNKQTLGISGYGASITTMEEVFIKVGEASNNEKSSASNPDDQTNSSNQNYGSVESVVDSSSGYDHNGTSCSVLKTLPKAEDLPSLTLDLNHFDSTKVPATDLSDKSIEITKMFNCYKNQFPSSSDNEFINVKADSFWIYGMSLFSITPFPNQILSAWVKLEFILEVTMCTTVNAVKGSARRPCNCCQALQVDAASLICQLFSPNLYLSNKAKGDISTFSLHWIVGAIFSQIKTNETKITAFFDNQAYHSAPLLSAYP